MTDDLLSRYFAAEKGEALLFVAVGLAAVALAAWIWRARASMRGAIAPLVAVAAIQLVVGGTVVLRTDAQVAALVQQRQSAPMAFRADETRRMKIVMANFTLYKAIEIALLAVGGALALRLRDRPFWFWFGLALAAQAAFMLLLDLFAEARGAAYLKALAGG